MAANPGRVRNSPSRTSIGGTAAASSRTAVATSPVSSPSGRNGYSAVTCAGRPGRTRAGSTRRAAASAGSAAGSRISSAVVPGAGTPASWQSSYGGLREPARAGQGEAAPAQLDELPVRAAARNAAAESAVDGHLAGQLVHRDQRLVVAAAAPAVPDGRVRVHRGRHAIVQPAAVRATGDAVGRVEAARVFHAVFARQRRGQQWLPRGGGPVLRTRRGPCVVIAASALLGHVAPSGRVVRCFECERGHGASTTGKTRT